MLYGEAYTVPANIQFFKVNNKNSKKDVKYGQSLQ